MQIADRSVSALWLLIVVLAVAILVASVVPVPAATPQTDPTGSVDTTTLLHIVGYATLTAGGVIAVAREGWPGGRQQRRGVGSVGTVAVIIALVALFGVVTELLQATIPWRTFAVTEIGLNAASATGGGLLATMWFYRPVE